MPSLSSWITEHIYMYILIRNAKYQEALSYQTPLYDTKVLLNKMSVFTPHKATIKTTTRLDHVFFA